VMMRGEGCVSSACKFFFFFFLFFFLSKYFHRKLKRVNPAVHVHQYQASTATGPLRNHLLKCHAEEWVKACQQDNVVLRGEQGKAAVAKVSGVLVGHQAEARIPFTQDNFIDALVQFIVATDQVFIHFLGFIDLFFANLFLGHQNC
jgi:hypothetical protein